MNYQTFEGWLYDRRKKAREAVAIKPAPPAEPVRWLEAVVKNDAAAKPEPKTQNGLVVRGPGGLWLEITSEEQIRLAALFWNELGKARTC